MIEKASAMARILPAAPYHPAELAADFKGVMRGVANTVTIVTASDETGRSGMVATAVCSVSMEPPSLLACVNRKASIFPKIMSSKAFCVNILSAEDAPILAAFSQISDGAQRFNHGHWDEQDGLAYLRTAQASIFCCMDYSAPYGTHTILVGSVRGVRTNGLVAPLIYLNGSTIASS